MAAMIPKPVARDFDVRSEYHYALAIWYEDHQSFSVAGLELQKARYHQEKEFWELVEEQEKEPAPLRRDLRPGSAANSVGMNRDPEVALHQAHGDAVMVSKAIYGRMRARSPFPDELPIWKNLSQGSQDYLIDDAKEAIRVLDERRNTRKA